MSERTPVVRAIQAALAAQRLNLVYMSHCLCACVDCVLAIQMNELVSAQREKRTNAGEATAPKGGAFFEPPQKKKTNIEKKKKFVEGGGKKAPKGKKKKDK